MESSRSIVLPGKRLGKLPKKLDPRTLRLANYIPQMAGQVPKPKAKVDYSKAVASWGMLRNDELGDCTIAGVLHMQLCWNDNVGRTTFAVTDAEALEFYEQVCGYNPKDPNSDQGGIELDVLNFWQSKGIAGHKITAFATVDRQRHDLVKLAIDWFGGIYIGVSLPLAAQNQKIWHPTKGPNAEPGSWGGHAIPIVAYDRTHLTCVTWGSLQKMTWGWFAEYCDEAYCAISEQDWLDATGKTPQGLDLVTLTSDLKTITA
jgi:hypothetical protein